MIFSSLTSVSTISDVILWNETFSIPNITLFMAPTTTGVDQTAANDLKEYINLNYSDSFLEIKVVKALDKEELFTRFHVILPLYLSNILFIFIKQSLLHLM